MQWLQKGVTLIFQMVLLKLKENFADAYYILQKTIPTGVIVNVLGLNDKQMVLLKTIPEENVIIHGLYVLIN